MYTTLVIQKEIGGEKYTLSKFHPVVFSDGKKKFSSCVVQRGDTYVGMLFAPLPSECAEYQKRKKTIYPVAYGVSTQKLLEHFPLAVLNRLVSI